MIRVMPALAGRNDQTVWNLPQNTGDKEVDAAWILKQPGTRDQRTEDSAFVRKWLTLDGLRVKEAAGIREVVVVTHGQLLGRLLGDSTNSFPVAFLDL